MTQSFGTLDVIYGCIFNSNDALYDTGDAMYITGSFQYISITQSIFKHNQSSQFIHVSDIPTVKILNSLLTLSLPGIDPRSKIAGAVISNAKNVLIFQTTFSNLVGTSDQSGGGGALLLTKGNSNKSPSNIFQIFSCTFINNTHDYGGGLSAINIGHVTIQNSMFFGNLANQ